MNHFKTTSALLPLALAAALAGCAQQPTASTGAAAAAPAVTAKTAAQVQRQALAKGLYELAYSPRQNALFVASSGGFGPDASPAKVLRLNPQTLAVEGEIPLERKAFGVTYDDASGRLYHGKDIERYPRDLRELAVDPANQRLFLAGHGGENGSVLYVVNTETLKVDKVLPGLGNAKAPGFAFDAAGQRLFVTNLLGELITISTRTLQITQRVKTDAEQPLNIAYDPGTQRLFVTDQGLENIRAYQAKSIPGFASKNPGNRVLVLDANTGKPLRSIATDAGPMGILLDAPRQRLYVTNRAAGKLSVYDARSYALLQTLDLPTHPNSLTLDAQRNVLYVSIKNGEKDPKGSPESVARVQF